MPLCYISARDPILDSLFSISFHLKVLSPAFHLEAFNDLNFLNGFWESYFIFRCGGSCHLPFIEFILSHLHSSSTNINRSCLKKLWQIIQMQCKLQLLVSTLGNISHQQSLRKKVDNWKADNWSALVVVWDILNDHVGHTKFI